jgi:3-hydroxyisobutyrate dehydrogenase
MTAVALLGTGTMGRPIARNLARAGHAVSAWNRTRDRAAPLAADGVRVAASAAEAAEGAEALVTMLADGPTVEAVAGPALAALTSGAVWVQMSTVGVPAGERLAALAADHGVAYVDAPVLGSREPAETAELVVLASGPEAERGRVDPLLAAVGRRTLWLGPAGAGSALKVVVNAWLMAITAALGETVALAERLRVDPMVFLDVTDGAEIGALYTRHNAAAMAARDFPLAFPLALAAKDAALALEAAGGDPALRVLAATHAQFARADALGLGDSDWAAVVHAALGEGAA